MLYVQDPTKYVPAFEILPEYLKTKEGDQVVNFRDWGIALGRRFRALKLWFVIRYYGVEGLKARISEHIAWAEEVYEQAKSTPAFEIISPLRLTLFSFRYRPEGLEDDAAIEAFNETLLRKLNDGGQIYLTQNRVRGRYAIRFAVGQANTARRHVQAAWVLIEDTARELEKEY